MVDKETLSGSLWRHHDIYYMIMQRAVGSRYRVSYKEAFSVYLFLPSGNYGYVHDVSVKTLIKEGTRIGSIEDVVRSVCYGGKHD